MKNFYELINLMEQDSLSEKIKSAAMELSPGKGRVRLADLREKLPDVPKKSIDEELKKMAINGEISLMQLDNPMEMKQRDKDAVWLTPAGDPRHLLYLK